MQAPIRLRRRPRALRPASLERLPVRAVQRAFELLALLGAGQEGTTLSDLARDSHLPVSTVARLLATLEQTGFIRRNAAGRYGPGTKLMQVGLASLRSFNVYDLAEPHLRRLSETSGETANLAVRADAGHAIYLRQVVSPRSIHHASWLGLMLPLRKTAVGAALLGEIDETGYSARRGSFDPDVTAIAAPVYGPTGEIVAALSVTGPLFRITERDVARFGTLVAKEAQRVSVELGAPSRDR